jgi:hypothetical protein
MKKADIKTIVILTVGFLLSLACRILWVMFVETEQMYDFAAYHLLAQNIANGLGHTMDGLPVAWQGMAYPYLLGLVYRITGNHTEMCGKVLNIVMSMFTLVAAWFIYIKLFAQKKYAVAAVLITAFLPQYIAFTNVLGTEVFFTFLLALIICGQLYFGHKWYSFPVIGILIGVAALTRPFMLAYPAVCAAVMWLTTKNLKRTLIFAGVLGIFIVFTVAPWTIRNYRVFGRFIPISYNAGYVLYTNHNDGNIHGTWMDLNRAAAHNPAALAVINESLQYGARSIKEAHDLEKFLRDEAMDWIKANPGEFLKLGTMRVYQTFFIGVNDIQQWAMNGWLPPDPHTEAEYQLYARNYRLVSVTFDTITYILNAAGFIFLIMSAWKLVKSKFDLNAEANELTALAAVNVAFFIIISFVYGGEARYAFPVFLFMVMAFVRICGLLSSDDGEYI